jgi:hypothetical protein
MLAASYHDYDTDSAIDTNLDSEDDSLETKTKPSEKQIFAGLCFYTNGSTAPLVSDHKLKQLLAMHGARHSIALGRRSVTHVILGTPNAHGGAGGGLAASKIQKEIGRTGGKAVKFITAEWYVPHPSSTSLALEAFCIQSRIELDHSRTQITDICRVLESIKANRRLPETQFSPLKLAPKSQNSVFSMMRTGSSAKSKKEQG